MNKTSLFRSISVAALLLISVSGCTERRADTVQQVVHPVADKTVILATIPGDQKLVPLSTGRDHTQQTTIQNDFIFSELGGGVVYTVAKDGLTRVVHNGIAGKPYKMIDKVVLSPDGKRVAYGVQVDSNWRMVVDGTEGPVLNSVRTPAFSPDGRHVTYVGMKDEKWYLVMDAVPSAGTKGSYQRPVFSSDSSRIAYVDQVDENDNGRLVVSDVGFKHLEIVATGGASAPIYNAGKTKVAATVLQDGKMRVIEFSFGNPDDIKKGAIYDKIQDLVFAPDGVSLAYQAERGGKHYVVLNDKEEALPEGALKEPPVARPDLKGVGTVVASGNQSYLWQSFVDGAKKGNSYDEIAALTYSRSNSRYAFAATKGKTSFVVVNGIEGPAFDRVVSPKFSPDGKYLVYRARKDGKRFVVVADTTGKTIRQHPTYEQVFDVTFTADGKSVAYGVKDGQKLAWRVEAL